MRKTYQELKTKLDEVILQLQDPETDVDKAIELHEQAKKLIAELETYLTDTEEKIKKTIK